MSSDKSSKKSYILKIFSQNVQKILDQRGLKQLDLAIGIGTDDRNVSNWLNFKATPNIVWVVKIANYFDVSLDELFDRIPNDPRPKIRDHAQKILTLAGGDLNSPKKSKKSSKKRKSKKKS